MEVLWRAFSSITPSIYLTLVKEFGGFIYSDFYRIFSELRILVDGIEPRSFNNLIYKQTLITGFYQACFSKGDDTARNAGNGQKQSAAFLFFDKTQL